jgi:signal transduction histidine kinase
MVFLLTLCFIYYLFLKRKRLIYYILLGSLCVGLGNILGLLSTYLRNNLHIFIGPENDLLYAQFGVIIEIICFTAGLSYKSRLSEKEKIKSQQMLINQLEENEILQLKMQNIRSEISRDLHDDVGATLSTILLYSNAAKQKRTAPNLQETQQAINKIGEIASRMIDNMGDMVWAVNPHNDNMGKIFN